MKHSDLSDNEFTGQFAACTLNPSLFCHEAHLRLAWIYIQRNGVSRACDLVNKQIQRFDQMHGDGSKYHATVTTACVKAVSHFMKKIRIASFEEFIRTHPRLKTNLMDLLKSHYGFDLLADQKARKEFVAPDLLPFDSELEENRY